LVGSDHHLEPGYPLGLSGSTIWDMPDLATTGRWSGHAGSCIGCPSIPSTPIRSDHGNLYFQKQPVFGHGLFVAATGNVL
jgi:hypothetical protein